MPNKSYFHRLLGQLCCCLSLWLLVGCATPPSPPSPPAKEADARGDIATYALSLLNAPYVWGGQDVDTGFDCSGFIAHVYRKAAGIQLRGNAAAMAKAGRAVSNAEVLTGDLVFFNTKGKPASHVGIYVGDNKFVHASNPRTGVRVDRLDNKYYAARFEGAKTLLPANGLVAAAQAQ
ncbi:MAG: C40 family peptidase [Polaromonas sp.]|nr:C40 family peptidase [Polaromonas sp.]